MSPMVGRICLERRCQRCRFRPIKPQSRKGLCARCSNHHRVKA